MDIKTLPITHTLLKTKKYELTFFCYAPVAMEAKSKYIVNCNPILYLSKVVPNFNDYSQTQLSGMRYRITPKNLYTTVRFFNRVLSWFYDSDKKDLFLIGTDNNIIFNGDYAKLCEITKKGYFENDMMKAEPAVVVDFNGLPTEGIHLHFNIVENVVDMTVSEVDYLLGFLSTFNFYAETSMALEVMRFTQLTNKGEIPPYVFSPNNSWDK